nr:MHC class I antigen ZLA transcript variant 1 [Danio rerio]
MAVLAVLFSAVMLLSVVPAWTEKHSLFYIYTALSRPVDLPGIYEFTAMGLLDDRQIDYYNSIDQKKIPKQPWMKEKMQEDYWEKGTQSRKSKEQWFNVNVNILMDRMRHNKSDVHVLQWRHGCEIDSQGNDVRFSKGIDEYSYDGENFLAFDDAESRWVAPVEEALPTKRKWDNVPILNQYTKGYLEKECVDWLKKFREYGDQELRKVSPRDVHVFAKRYINGKDKLKLTCLATGFYPKDVYLTIRKYRTALSDNDLESSGVRPNHDGTFQLRKSTYINEDEKAEYDCYVNHRTLKEPVIIRWNGECLSEPPIAMIAGIIGVLILLGAIGVTVWILKKKNIIGNGDEKHFVVSTVSGNKDENGFVVSTVSGNKDEKRSMPDGSADSGKGSSA